VQPQAAAPRTVWILVLVGRATVVISRLLVSVAAAGSSPWRGLERIGRGSYPSPPVYLSSRRGMRTSAFRGRVGGAILAGWRPPRARCSSDACASSGSSGGRWDAARAGCGTTVLVAGDAGIGKTRLASELAARARDAGFEVLALLARGYTNREIAAALVISVRTAGRHVSHILRKLSAPNRLEAAAIAHRLSPPHARQPALDA
jgi:DNA-binding CsgD family transcriptional regulator